MPDALPPPPACSLIRRRLDGGRLREFTHSEDGSTPQERPVLALSSPPPFAPSGVPSPPGQLVPRAPRPEDAQLPIHVPMLRSSCDAKGACCGLFHHIPVLAEERDALLTTMAEGWDGFVPLDQLVHPAFEAGPDSSFNIGRSGGSCAFLRDDGLCGPLLRGGPLAKPLVCRSFPCTLVLCGDEWHASLRPECACIARTAIEGAELQADLQSWVAFRSTLLQVQTVPDSLRIRGDLRLPRSEYVAWMRRAVGALRTSFAPIAVLRAAADDLEGEGTPGDPEARPPQVWLDQVQSWVSEARDQLGDAYDPRSPYRLTVEWADRVATTVAAGTAIDRPQWSRGRAADWARRAASASAMFLHGHGLLEARALGPAVRDLGHLLWLARAGNAVQPAEEADPRLESTTSWLFLWRTVGRIGVEPPLSLSGD